MIFSYAPPVLLSAAALGAAAWSCACFLRRAPSGDGPARALTPLRAALAGVALFFIVESAVARRVGPDLLLPWAGGALLPWRLARMAACLAACFALALTDRGRALGRALDRFCQRDRGRWAASAAVTAVFFLWTLRVTLLAYMTMDDVTFLQAIAQIPEKGMSVTASVFSGQLLCWLLGKLYGLYPDGLWYLGYHLAVLLSSITILGRCILCRTGKRGWPVWTGCVIHGLMCAGTFLYCFAAISFTVTPAVAGSAAVALILCRDENKTAAGRVCSDAASVLLMCLCALQRLATGRALLCFWALAAAYQLVKMLLRHGRRAQIALFLVMSLAAPPLVLGVGGVELEPIDPSYGIAEYYRSLIGDYLNDQLTLEQYERAGIDRELATLIHTWFFMDERVTTELFRDLADIYYADQAAALQTSSSSSASSGASTRVSPAAAPALVANLLARLAQRVRADQQMLWRGGCVAALLLACLAAFLRFGRRYWPELLCALCAVGGAAILLMYLIWEGRFLLRVFLVVEMPAAVVLLLTALTAPDGAAAPGRGRLAAGGTLAALSCAALAVCCAMLVRATPRATEALDRPTVFSLQNAIEDYAAANRDKLIISRVYDHQNANTDPLHPISKYPTNIVQWGYCGDTAKSPEERLYADAFFRDDVLFMHDELVSLLNLLQYLSVDYGPVQALTVASLSPTVSVSVFSRVSPGEEGYTGWYEQNGMTYYFRDGQAVTGEQFIDGERYTFAPAGAEAQFSVMPGPDGMVYSTDAYSLVEPEAETP